MILLTVPIFFPVISALDFGLITMEQLHYHRAMDVLNAGLPEGMTDAMLGSIRETLDAGLTLSREQLQALGLRITPFQLEQIQIERTAIWFGILVLIVVEVGLITPPVGMNLFIINAMDRATSMIETYKAVLYYVASDLIRVAILVAFPAITLFLIPW
jgi:C4-dicarboxylate transporter DctM subunit